jgi:SAM-dependent methyltransferase
MAIIGYTIYNNWQTKKRYHSGDIQTSSGAIQTRMTLSENIAYVNCVFADYLKYSGISRDTLGEKKILQIGPGDNFAVALKLLAMGARQVVCVDRFFPKQNAEQQYQLYQAVREELSEEERRTFDTVVNLNGKIEVNTQKLLPIHGMAIEAAESRLEPESFDLILSRSVLEHLYDPDQAFSVMDRLLAPGGRMVHKIDFRDHGMFTDSGFHPLTFLTIPESVYRLMTLDSGRPNRRLFNYYRDKMTALHYDAQIFITHVVGSDGDLVPSKERAVFGVDYSDATVALLDKIRPKLRAQFRKMSNEELMVSGIFLIARKSSVATRNSEKLVL